MPQGPVETRKAKTMKHRPFNSAAVPLSWRGSHAAAALRGFFVPMSDEEPTEYRVIHQGLTITQCPVEGYAIIEKLRIMPCGKTYQERIELERQEIKILAGLLSLTEEVES
jgi:hypothetical protein